MSVSSVGAPAESKTPYQKRLAAAVGLRAALTATVARAWVAANFSAGPIREFPDVTVPVIAGSCCRVRSRICRLLGVGSQAPVSPAASGCPQSIAPGTISGRSGDPATSDRRQRVDVSLNRTGL